MPRGVALSILAVIAVWLALEWAQVSVKENRLNGIARTLAIALATCLLALGLSACEKKEGPAERAGKEVDKAVESVGEKIEKTGQQIQDAAQDAKK